MNFAHFCEFCFFFPWWASRPRKKIFSLSQNAPQTPSRPPAPPSSPGEPPPPLVGVLIKTDTPPLPVAPYSPFTSPEPKKNRKYSKCPPSFLRKTITTHIELLFQNAPVKSSWTDLSLVWFAGATPETTNMAFFCRRCNRRPTWGEAGFPLFKPNLEDLCKGEFWRSEYTVSTPLCLQHRRDAHLRGCELLKNEGRGTRNGCEA